MSYYFVTEELYFPPIAQADEHGILAFGGDLSPERLILAYQSGIFPWFSENEPIIWWSPDPRFVLFPQKLKVSKSMRPIFNKKEFEVSFDTNFKAVIEACQQVKRKGQSGTWITDEMLKAYCELHRLGLAHSVEVWKEGDLVGGLYGIALGRSFFGESMFSKINNASKVGFITLVRKLQELDFDIIDCQVHTKHLESLGAEFIARDRFLDILNSSIKKQILRGNWKDLIE